MKSGYAFKDAVEFYEEGSNTKLTGDDLKKALASGKKLYTATKDDGQTTDKIATKGKDYDYVTKLYDEDGKEVSADDVLNGMKADGKTAATNYYTSDAGSKGFAANKCVQITAANAKKTDGTGFLEQFDVNGTISFSLHVGADSESNNKIEVKVDAMSAAGVGVKGLKVDTEADATAAIDRIAEAVSKVSSQRSSLGAVQNRLEHTIANLDNVVENTTSAESRIRDVDMAEEMVEYSKNNILAQAGQSMLAQANQATQGVLSLLG